MNKCGLHSDVVYPMKEKKILKTAYDPDYYIAPKKKYFVFKSTLSCLKIEILSVDENENNSLN